MKAYIFDLDGTLVDTLSSIAFYGNKALAKYGFGAIDLDRYKILVGNGRDKLIHRMLREFCADTEENYRLVGEEYDRLYEADVVCLARPYPGVVDMLTNLKSRGDYLAVLSNKPDNVVVPIVSELFPGLFDLVYGYRKNVALKPEPEGAFLVAKELGVEASECIFIGDTDNDILTGVNAGMKTVGVLWGFRDERELKAAGADYIVSSAKEIE